VDRLSLRVKNILSKQLTHLLIMGLCAPNPHLLFFLKKKEGKKFKAEYFLAAFYDFIHPRNPSAPALLSLPSSWIAFGVDSVLNATPKNIRPFTF
jgi:hypothetical protein